MKAIIYFSLNGRTEKQLKERFEGDYFKLEKLIKLPKHYLCQMFVLGFYSSFGIPLKYKEFEIDFDKYDEIVLGSPVWAGKLTPIMRRFLKNNKFKNKKVTLLITHEGGPGKALAIFKKYLDPSNEIVKEESIKLISRFKEIKEMKQKK